MEREGGNGTGWSPAIEVSQGDGKYNIHAELPGFEPKDVKVDVENDALVIQGERRFEQEEKEGGVQRTERQYGLFYRSIPLPEGAKVEQAHKQSSIMAYWKSRFRFRNSKVIDAPFLLKQRAFHRSHPKARLHKPQDLTALDRSAVRSTISISDPRGLDRT
jgi:hypothetical protein